MKTIEQITEEIKSILTVGSKFTTFHINDMGFTSKQQFTVKQIDAQGRPIVVFKDKRKMFYFRLFEGYGQTKPTRAAIFAGWNTPITCDSDTNTGTGINHYRGNACLNFVGQPDAIRAWIDKDQLNPNFEKYRVIAIIGNLPEDEIVVYPDLYEAGGHSHAVIDRLLANKVHA